MTKSLNRSINKKFTAFNNAKKCQCGADECLQKHWICHLCDKMMHREVQVNLPSQLPHKFCWNIEHMTDRQFQGTNANENLIAAHPWCNNKKSNNTRS
jgi:hypothetical protein